MTDKSPHPKVAIAQPSSVPAGSPLYLGIDLSTDSAKIGAAVVADLPSGVIAWRPSGAATDDAIASWFASSAAMGIDVPLGWPMAFVNAITSHQLMARFTWPERQQLDSLAWRTTDFSTSQRVGQHPLRVTADKIGKTAMRGARLQALLPGGPYARDGSERLVEVYPAAALKAWGLPHEGYKGSQVSARTAILNLLTSGSPAHNRPAIQWSGNLYQDCINSDDLMDAVICALIARATGESRCSSVRIAGS